MAFQVSPGVLVQEKDLTNIVPAVSTSIGAYAFSAKRGPVGEITLISNEQDLVSLFGKPTTDNFEEYFTSENKANREKIASSNRMNNYSRIQVEFEKLLGILGID